MITLLLKEWLPSRDRLILPIQKQIKSWRKANRKMGWRIPKAEFDKIIPPPQLTQNDREDGFIGTILSYGFGDDGNGNSDSVLSTKRAWEYARKRKWAKTWQCEYIDFKRIDDIRLRPDAPARPSGFYFTKFQPGEKFLSSTVSQVRKNLITEDTGCGPEGIQFLTISHPHFQTMMNERKIPFIALADFDVAPHGFNDFYDAPQLFCSNDTLGLGIGNIDNNYPLFGIPTLRFQW
jgi:hypothetical protein